MRRHPPEHASSVPAPSITPSLSLHPPSPLHGAASLIHLSDVFKGALSPVEPLTIRAWLVCQVQQVCLNLFYFPDGWTDTSTNSEFKESKYWTVWQRGIRMVQTVFYIYPSINTHSHVQHSFDSVVQLQSGR